MFLPMLKYGNLHPRFHYFDFIVTMIISILYRTMKLSRFFDSKYSNVTMPTKVSLCSQQKLYIHFSIVADINLKYHHDTDNHDDHTLISSCCRSNKNDRLNLIQSRDFDCLHQRASYYQV